jgi:hypothetical protein
LPILAQKMSGHSHPNGRIKAAIEPLSRAAPVLRCRAPDDDHGLPIGLQLIGRRGRAGRMQKKGDWYACVPDAIHDLIEIDKNLPT